MDSNNGVPQKPWEINRGQSPNTNNYGNLRSSSHLVENKIPPPVPVRPAQQRTNSPMYRSNYGMGYSSYGGGGYGGVGGYGGYGMYGGSPYYGSGGMYGSSYRGGPGTPGTFTQHAEENTRQAFQSVESIVRAFTSVSTMLESTLGAVYSSFRAVLDVADHFSRVKATFTDILSSITIFRFLRFLYRRALSILRLHPCDDAWEVSSLPGTQDPSVPGDKKSWPIMMFVAVVIGGPYLIWKLLRGSDTNNQSQSSWMNGEGDHVIAKAEYNFQGSSSDELSFQAGDRIILAPRDLQPNIRGWLLGTIDGKSPGYLPSNYVKVLGLKKAEKQGKISPTTSSDNVEKQWGSIHSSTLPYGGSES